MSYCAGVNLRVARVLTALTLLAAASVPLDETASAISYDPMNCARGYYSRLRAGQYLDTYGDGTDRGYCAPAGVFDRRNGYLPVFATEANVANDYGRVAVRQSGGCSFAPDTGPTWDFQLPCKAHDYCYDLRKAGFSGTVSDNACDDWFDDLMEAHCNNRVFKGLCRDARDLYAAAVRAPGVVTDPDPAQLSVKAVHSNKCLAIRNASTASGAYLVQGPCSTNLHYKFKFVPISNDYNGYFRLKPQHAPTLCLRVDPSDSYRLKQGACTDSDWQRFKIAGSFNENKYTLRTRVFDWCVDVPYASTETNLIITVYFDCHQSDHQRFILA